MPLLDLREPVAHTDNVKQLYMESVLVLAAWGREGAVLDKWIYHSLVSKESQVVL